LNRLEGEKKKKKGEKEKGAAKTDFSFFS